MRSCSLLAISLVAAILLDDFISCQQEGIFLAKLKNKSALNRLIRKFKLHKMKTQMARKNWRRIILGAGSVVNKAKGTVLKKAGSKKIVKGKALGPLGIPKKIVAKVIVAKGVAQNVKGAVLGIKSVRAKVRQSG